MSNIVINMCEKFHYDRLRNDKALESRKSDNNKNPIEEQQEKQEEEQGLWPLGIRLLVQK